MLKKGIILTVVLLLVLMFGCAKKENPFSPQKDGFNNAVAQNISFIAALNPGDGGTIQDLNPSTTEIEGELDIYFNDFMDASTITSSNIIVRDTTNGVAIQNASVTYYPEIKKAVFTGTFSNDAVFVVTLKCNIKNKAGVELDGNGNGLQDGSPYDDFKYRLKTGSGNVNTVDFEHPEINFKIPGIQNAVSLKPAITLTFTGADIDTNTLTLSNFNLTKTSNQVAVSCSLVAVSPGTIIFTPKDSLDQATQYTVTVKCANVTDTSGNVLLGFQGENQGWIENIPDYTWDFITDVTDTLHDGTPPTVTSVNTSSTGELIVKFDDDMDTSTFTSTNIRVYNNATGQNLVGSIINEADGKGFRYTLENATSGTTYKLWISKDVKEADPGEWNLDGNSNGVGGEYDDDYVTTFTAP